MESNVSPGRIHTLVMENFKSYHGSQTIGPFKGFTAIIGPSGAGKSNIMYAFKFVLGVGAELPEADLEKLIYAGKDGEKEQRARKASVSLVCVSSGKEMLTFARTISCPGGTRYKIDGEEVDWNTYNASLQSLKIWNFLVFQEGLQSLADKNPYELSALIEQISGSGEKSLKREMNADDEKLRKRKTRRVNTGKMKVDEEEYKTDESEGTYALGKKVTCRDEKLVDLYTKVQEAVGKLPSDFNIVEYQGDKKEDLHCTQHCRMQAQKRLAVNLQQWRNWEKEEDSRENKLKFRVGEFPLSLQKYKDELTDLHREQDELLKSKTNHKNLMSELEEVEQKLKSFGANGYEKRDDELSQAVETLKRAKLFVDVDSLKAHVTGVHGLMTDLCKIAKEDEDCVAGAMGKFMDAVVVEDENTGRECIKYLKQKSRPPWTFIPLKSVCEKSLDTLDPTAKPDFSVEQLQHVIDAIQFHPSHREAILSAVGNTFVCNNLADAKRLSSKGGSFRFVTRDGTLLTESGTMTGGTTRGVGVELDDWDYDIEDLKKKKKYLESSLVTFGEKILKESEVCGKISILEKKIEFVLTEQKIITDKLSKVTDEKQRIVKEIKSIEGLLDKLNAEINNKTADISLSNHHPGLKYSLVNEAFCHISNSIDKIYKKLTKSSTHPDGGRASLELVHGNVLSGIRYKATADPYKPLRNLEELSGGEKTVAALALLFSIHSYMPLPFFILDEVDAKLEGLNVANVAGFLRSESCEATGGKKDADSFKGFQSIVESIQGSFYGKAEALIGVYRDNAKKCSGTLSLDLTQYEYS